MDFIPYALITGGSRGIGKALAAQLASRGYHLLLVASTETLLQATKQEFASRYPQVNVEFLAIDLSSDTAAKAVFEWSIPYHCQIQVFINNAGYGISGTFFKKDLEVQLGIIDVNFRTLAALTYLFIPILGRQRKAYILNTASTAAYQAVPYLSIYAASKAAVLAFSRSIRYELRETSISVSCLSPGSTDTHFADRAQMSDALKKTAERFNMSPEQVASAAVKGLLKGKAEIIPGFTNKLNAILPRFFPKSWAEKIAGSIYEPK